jgi:hypothetical protein
VRGRTRATGLAFLIAVSVAMIGCAPPEVASPTPSAAIVVTFEVNDGERFRVLLIDPADQAIANRLLDGGEGPDIPNGRIVRDTGVNEGWSWSLDPADFEFADLTTEVCDGEPSDVESGTLTSDRYCPWSARVVEIEPAS